MKQELELARTHVVRWAKAPQIVTPELQRKENLTRSERLWVYSSVFISLISLAISALAVVWLTAPVTNKDTAIGILFVTVTIFTLALCRALSIACSPNGNPLGRLTSRGSTKPVTRNQLNFTGRKQLCLYDRNRKRMPWYKERLQRYADADGQYTQLSVWLEAGTNIKGVQFKGVQFHVFQHERRRYGPWDISVFAHNGQVASDFLNDPAVEEIIDKQHQLESLAREYENEGYEKVVGDHTLRRDVLRLRR